MDDLISRQAAIDAIEEMQMPIMRSIFQEEQFVFKGMSEALSAFKDLPSAQQEIIRCRECKFASGDSRICMKFDHSPIGELDFCSFAERREGNNESD